MFSKKGCFLSFERETSLPEKSVWLPLDKSTIALSLEKILPTPVVTIAVFLRKMFFPQSLLKVESL